MKFQEIIKYLKTLSPSGIEIEFISLSSFDVDKDQTDPSEKLISPNATISKMMGVFEKCIEANIDCDFVQAMLNVFLKKHSDIIIEDVDLTDKMVEIKDKMDGKFDKLEHLINGNLCMTQYFAAVDNF
jgi:hypothetical protein|tara:strand:- start:86 stop:469 length:384 start_codon:yes stop_codon:yes gene_type:complete